jgi:S-adenosylmethionine synthetase
VVISSQHKPSVTLEQLRADLKKHVIQEVIPGNLLDDNTLFYLNPCGSFIVGGKNVSKIQKIFTF